MQGICAGLSVAHRRGVIHRDLKPDNIIVVPAERLGATETVKVIDFGIAKLRESDVSTLTQTGMLMGTPFYMSPEQCLGEELDRRSDVYSLGAILYEMLGGAPPFMGGTATTIAMRHLNEIPAPLDQLGVAPALARITERALQKKRDERYQSVEDLYVALADGLKSSSGSVAADGQVGTASTVRSVIASPTQAQAPVINHTLPIGQATTQPIATAAAKNLAHPPSTSGRALRRVRNFAISGGLLVFVLSVALGLLVRWIGWANQVAYDEFALIVITDAFRDAIFGVFLGIAAGGLWRSSRVLSGGWKDRAASLIVYAASGAAVAMAPFVLLRTSLFLLPIVIAVLGSVVGMLVWGIKTLLQTISAK